jgi:hypothetical protein
VSAQTKCLNCGAMMVPRSDGRIFTCPYCSAEAQVAIESGQIAAGLKLDLANADQFLQELAMALHGHFGERTKLKLEGTQVQHFEVNLDPHLFVAKRETHGIVTQYKKLVRGIALKTTHHPLDRWVQLLTEALASHANENARVAQVLSHLQPK